MRLSDRFLLLALLLSALTVATLVDANRLAEEEVTRRAATRSLVARLGLTDPALFTEARYSRHLSQADLHAPFQDHPMAYEHFPSGSLTGPPQRQAGR